MHIFRLDDATANLDELIEDAVKDETILIMDEQQRIVQLSPVTSNQKARKVRSPWQTTSMRRSPILTSTHDEAAPRYTYLLVIIPSLHGYRDNR